MLGKSKLILAACAALMAGGAAANASLSGAIYLESKGQTGPFTTENIATNAAAAAASGTPDVTFTSTLVNSGATYSGCDGCSVSSFLSAIPADAATASANPSPVGTFVMDLKGYLTASVSGSYTFTTNDDDGGAFFIGGNGTSGTGTILAENDGDHPQQQQQSNYSLTAGQTYRIELVYYNDACAGCGYNGTTNTNGGGAVTFDSIVGPGVVSLSQTPEPASLSLLAFGGLGLLARRRR